MADAVSNWLIDFGTSATLILALFGFVIKRNDLTGKRIDAIEVSQSKLVERAKREAAEALMAVATRLDSRHEAIRQELNIQVRDLSARIDRIGDDMVRREDFQALGKQFADLQSRIDRLLERGRA